MPCRNHFLRSKRGFTLIELLIVMFIIALVSASFIFQPRQANNARELSQFAELIKAQMEVAKEESILQDSTLALVFNRTTYQFYRYTETEDSFIWTPLALHDPFWRVYKIPATLIVNLEAEPSPESAVDSSFASELPLIIFYSSGEVSPFQLRISGKKGKTTLEIDGASSGNLSLKRMTDE